MNRKVQLISFYILLTLSLMGQNSGFAADEVADKQTLLAQKKSQNTPNTTQQGSEYHDIGVLIDVSGSMKKTDPKNLRIPALKLLVRLLPANTRAAIWNFGTDVQLLVKPAKVDDKWKKQALLASKKIHSRDLFTHIGKALLVSQQGLSSQKENIVSQNIILLTDGMVDISKDDNKNIMERDRILKQLLPQITQQKIQIHTIALSDMADFEFLKKLSTTSDGSFESAENADKLERMFLHLFEKATQPDTVPLINNNFKIDDSIYEMTLLVFKDKNAPNKVTEVVAPNGETFTRATAPKRTVKWHSEDNYDLITIHSPQAGDWKINAPIDPDNRVLVVTNLKIKTNYLPNNVFLGEQIELKMFLADEKGIITDDEFLELTSLKIRQQPVADPDNPDDTGQENPPAGRVWYLHDNGLRGDKTAHDGIFHFTFGKQLQPGINAYELSATSATFSRALKKTFVVHDIPLLIAELQVDEQKNMASRITVTPNLEYINPKKIKISAQLIKAEDDSEQSERISLKNDHPDTSIEWYFDTEGLDPDADYSIVFHMQSHTRRGRPVNYTSKRIRLNINRIIEDALYTESKDADIKVTVKQQPQMDEDDTASQTQTENSAADATPEDEAEHTTENGLYSRQDWITGIIITIVANIVFILAGWLLYRRWKKNNEMDLIDLTGDEG